MIIFYEELADALDRVAGLEGVCCVRDLDEIGIKAGCFDDYILLTYLSQLLRRDEMRIEVKPDRIPYMLKLLHMEEKE